MSSRALRKLQREQEEQKQLAQIAAEQEDGNESESDGAPPPTKQTPRNAFDFLNDANDDDEESEDQAEEVQLPQSKPSKSRDPDSESEEPEPAPPPKSKKRGKKKKKKGGKAKELANDSALSTPQPESGLDEIDLALKDLKVKGTGSVSDDPANAAVQEDLKKFYALLAVDQKNLNALNEMKRLFGSTVLEAENAGAGQARRRGRGPQQLDLGGALAGRNNPVSKGQGLAGLALRRNALIQGKEEWPKATSGGLGMELVEKAWDFTTEYRFIHNTEYQRTQAEFDVCVELMDPQRMIHLLQYNPYHISTLLQVSEIAKQQGDHSVSADLLERALFTFGRSVQSTFQTSLNEGKARFDFRRPENREFWLSAWRYLMSLGQRGTWRTAYEWAKLLLSLDPEDDPYRIRLIIDQLAIRGGQFENFIDLAATKVVDWGQELPNIQISLAMAHYRLKHAKECRELLSRCVRRFPWIFERLFRELDLEKLPKSIWGQQPRTPLEELQTASYVLRAKDIWNTPEATTFLVEVVESVEGKSLVSDPSDEEISRNDARHILLSDIPALISNIPRSFTTEHTSSSDPLPPEDNILSYGALGADDDDEDDENSDSSFEREFPPRPQRPEGTTAASWLRSVAARFGIGVQVPDDASEESTDALARVIEEFGPRVPELRGEGGQAAREALVNEEALRRESEQLARALAASERDAEEREAREREEDLRVEQQAREFAQMMREDMQAQLDAEAEASARGTQGLAERPAEGLSTEPAAAASASASGSYDDQANQRWLAGRGMLALKGFVAAHGADEKVWKDDLEVDSRPATEYAFRAMQLKQRSSRDFILNYSLPQGAGKDAAELIKRMIAS